MKLVIGCSVLAIGLGVPLILRWIPPNRYYGFRTSTTLATDSVWYAANAWCGIVMIVSGALGLMGVLLAKKLASDAPSQGPVWVPLACMLTPLTVGVLLLLWFQKRL